MKRIIAFLMIFVTLTMIIPVSISSAATHVHSNWKTMAETVTSYSNVTETGHTAHVLVYQQCGSCSATKTKRITRTVGHSFGIYSATTKYEKVNLLQHRKVIIKHKRCACGKIGPDQRVDAGLESHGVVTPHRDKNGFIDGYNYDCDQCGMHETKYD